MILLVIFVVAMILWGVSLATDSYGKVGMVCAWIAVLILFLLFRHVNV
jgi:hypothetical protein